MPWTVKQLYNSTVQVSSSRKFYSSSKTRRIVRVIPYVGSKTVLFQLEHYGITVNAQHAVNLLFGGLEITEEGRSLDTHLKVPYKGRQYWVQKVDYDKSPVLVRCTCPDFYFTFAYWNWKAGAIFGPKPRPYKRKTKTRGPRNPSQHPGYCKHCYNSFLLFQTNSWTERSGMSKFAFSR